MQSLPEIGLETPVPAQVPTRGASYERIAEPPLENNRLARSVTFLIVVGATLFTFIQLRPGLLFGPNLDVGGDNAAHVTAVYYFIHHLLPRGQLSGWDPQWFNGFPLYVFYFPLPSVIIAALSVIFPYNVAFNLVTVLGILTLPVAAYGFGRLAGFARPLPALMSAAMLPFLFNTSYTIDGGNIASTLAGEYSFTLGLSFALVFLGVFAKSLRTGRMRWLAALLFALCVLSHVVPALFAVGGAGVLLAMSPGRRSLRIAIVIGAIGALLSAFWLLPFAADLRYSSSMGYGRVGDVLGNLFPASAEQVVQWLALLGAVIAVAQRNRVALALAVLALGAVGAFTILPSGFVYNARWLPFWFLATSLLAAYAICESGRFLFAAFGHERSHQVGTALIGFVIPLIVIAAYIGVLPGYTTSSSARSFVPDWVSFNYTGYQGKPGWNQFSQVVNMLEKASATYGCGRLDYEYSPHTTDEFGSTLVPMSFPYWTGGCIDAAEGVYYESSTSNDFHFLDQAELSVAPSNPVVGIPYQSLNVDDGIRHLQLQGIKYFLANSPTVEAAADVNPTLVRIASTAESADVVDQSSSTPPSGSNFKWVLYKIRNAPLVTPVSFEPVVESGLSKMAWQTMAINWYQSPADWPIPIVSTGPSNWPREEPGKLVGPGDGVPVAKTTVSNIVSGDESISFNVSRLNVPVLVKVPYFPNWHATGASGPYASTPNLMIVIPTSHHVSLNYGSSGAGTLGKGASLIGAVGLAVLMRSGAAPTDSFESTDDDFTDDDLTDEPTPPDAPRWPNSSASDELMATESDDDIEGARDDVEPSSDQS